MENLMLPGMGDGRHVCAELTAIVSVSGETLGERCATCGKVQPRCRVCRVIFKALPQHLAQSMCGKWDKQGLWWTPNRPPWAAYT